MTETADRYRRLAGDFGAKIAAVPADRWESPSPCEEWNARQVVGHVVGTQGMFLGFIDKSPGDGPSVDDDPAGAWAGVSASIQAVLDDPVEAATEFDGFSGRTTFESAVDRFLNFDLVVHAWDLSRATGLDENIDLDDIHRLTAQLPEFGDALHSPGVCGPELEVGPDADDQTRFLAVLGRRD
jgi:uncharacterized protein (TIGR03086 family)